MKQGRFIIEENRPLTETVFRMTLCGDTSDIQSPGQFVNVHVDGLFLRRPISVCDCEGNRLTLIYKTVGTGTDRMSRMNPGDELDLLTGLGNGYDLSVSGDHPLLLGGGVGVPPLYWLAKRLLQEGKTVTGILGFNTKNEIFYEEAFRSLGCRVFVTTVDGSDGIKGFVTDAMHGLDYSYFYACGPLPMLKALYRATKTSGQFSLEERMGCGFGACMGCSLETASGPKRVCRDGPVFVKEDLLWEK